jgi:hypothetical protein
MKLRRNAIARMPMILALGLCTSSGIAGQITKMNAPTFTPAQTNDLKTKSPLQLNRSGQNNLEA